MALDKELRESIDHLFHTAIQALNQRSREWVKKDVPDNAETRAIIKSAESARMTLAQCHERARKLGLKLNDFSSTASLQWDETETNRQRNAQRATVEPKVQQVNDMWTETLLRLTAKDATGDSRVEIYRNVKAEIAKILA